MKEFHLNWLHKDVRLEGIFSTHLKLFFWNALSHIETNCDHSSKIIWFSVSQLNAQLNAFSHILCTVFGINNSHSSV